MIDRMGARGAALAVCGYVFSPYISSSKIVRIALTILGWVIGETDWATRRITPFPRKKFLPLEDEENIRKMTNNCCSGRGSSEETTVSLFQFGDKEYFLKENSIKELRQRHQNLQRAQRICDAYGLNRLVIPHSRLLENEEGTQAVLVEESLCLKTRELREIIKNGEFFSNFSKEKFSFVEQEVTDPSSEEVFPRTRYLENIQSSLFRSSSYKLDSVFKQFVYFILISGYSDVGVNNNPLLYANGEFYMGLYDLEYLSQDQTSLSHHVDDVKLGLLLFKCGISKRHANLMKIEAIKKVIFLAFLSIFYKQLVPKPKF